MENVYSPPLAKVEEHVRQGQRHAFFLVSTRKLLLMGIATFGYYLFVWWYMHWARQRRAAGSRVLPAARALFSLFFAHVFVHRVDSALQASAQAHAWRPMIWATAYVVLVVGSAVLSLAAMDPTPDVVVQSAALLGFLPALLTVVPMQRAVNAAVDDVEGRANDRLTGANIAWLVVFGLLWLANFASLVLLAIGWAADPIDVQLPAP